MKEIKSTRMVILMMYAILIVLLIGVQVQAVQTKPQTDTSLQGTVGSPAGADQLDQHFQMAQDDLIRKNSAGAAAEIQKAAAFLEGEEKRSVGDAEQLIGASVRELKQLARQLKDRTAVPEEKVRQVFGGCAAGRRARCSL